MTRKLIRYLAHRHGKATGLYRRLCRPGGRSGRSSSGRQGRLYHLGTGCSILPSTTMIDPAYTWIGDRVCLATCTLIAHDGSIEVLYRATYGLRIDRIAPIIIENDVVVGHNAMLLGGTTIGEGSIVGPPARS